MPDLYAPYDIQCSCILLRRYYSLTFFFFFLQKIRFNIEKLGKKWEEIQGPAVVLVLLYLPSILNHWAKQSSRKWTEGSSYRGQVTQNWHFRRWRDDTYDVMIHSVIVLIHFKIYFYAAQLWPLINWCDDSFTATDTYLWLPHPNTQVLPGHMYDRMTDPITILC